MKPLYLIIIALVVYYFYEQQKNQANKTVSPNYNAIYGPQTQSEYNANNPIQGTYGGGIPENYGSGGSPISPSNPTPNPTASNSPIFFLGSRGVYQNGGTSGGAVYSGLGGPIFM